MVKVGISGSGWIVEKAHIPAFKKLKNCRVISIYDIDSGRLQYIQEKFNIPSTYTNYEQFLCSGIDVVVIATPNYTHSQYTNLAISNCKHVLCEKPVALKAKDYMESIKLAHDNRTIILPAFVNRFRPDTKILKGLLTESNLGTLYKVNTGWMRKSGVPRPGSWITNKTYSGGGVLADLGSHIFDICLMAVDDKRIKKAELKYLENKIDPDTASWCESHCDKTYLVDVEVTASGSVEFMGGVELNFSLSWDCDTKGDYTYFEYIFEKGKISMHTLFGFGTNPLYNNIQICVESQNEEKKYEMPIKFGYAEKAFEYQAAHFVETVVGKKTDFLISQDGLYVTELIESLYASKL